jgi:3-deoxy-D-manno-octulosonic acid kinase
VAKSSGIRSISEQVENDYIIYDAQLAGQISSHWFEPEFWRRQGELQAIGTGRGQAWFVEHQQQAYVLRHYCRGGLAARISSDRYVWLGLPKTRAWREYHLLVKIQELGLAAPRPLAARVRRYGAFYSADLLTQRIPNSQPLSCILAAAALAAARWRDIGTCIRAFHRHAIYHADLNAHNILLDDHERVFLIDFDKGGLDQDHSWQQRNLQRLRRSLLKLQTQGQQFHFSEADWRALLDGYHT